MPRYSSSYSRYSSASPATTGIRESAITWSSSGGHNHDGDNASLIDFERYTVFDFGLNPIFTTNSRSIVQDRNIVSFENYVVDIISRNTITPQSIIINNDTFINGENISVRTITTNQLATDSIKSLNFDYSSGYYSNTGSFFNLADGVIRTPSMFLDSSGNLYLSNSVTIGATSVSTVVDGAAAGANAIPTGGAATDVNDNFTTINGGKIRTGNIESTGFVRGSGTYSTTGTRLDLDTGDIIAPNFRLFSNGVIYAQSGNFSGTVNASGGTFTGKITAGLTEVGTNIRGAADYAGIALRNDSWENAWVRRSDNSVYFRAGSSTKYIQVDTTGTTTIQFPNFSVDNSGNVVASNVSITGGTLDIGGSDSSSFHVSSSGSHWAGSGSYATAPFRVSSTGALTASSVAITGGTLDIGGSDSTSFHVASNGAHWAGNSSYSSAPFRVSSSGALVASSATITGEINATSGNFSGNLTSSAVISGGEFAGGVFSLSSGSSVRIRFGTSYGTGIDVDGGPYGDMYIGLGIVGFEGNYYNVPESYGRHNFLGRVVVNRTNYGNDWSDQQLQVNNGSGNAGIAIRATNDAGTVQIRVGASNPTAYFRGHSTGLANIDAGGVFKTAGTFKIPHPLEEKRDDYWLYHSFIEGPFADLIYRGVVDLVDGYAEVNIDEHSQMTNGTFVNLVNNVSCFTSNETSWDNVKGVVDGNILKIYCQNSNSTDTISWLVIGERCDEYMLNTDWTDDNGRVIQEQRRTEDHLVS